MEYRVPYLLFSYSLLIICIFLRGAKCASSPGDVFERRTRWHENGSIRSQFRGERNKDICRFWATTSFVVCPTTSEKALSRCCCLFFCIRALSRREWNCLTCWWIEVSRQRAKIASRNSETGIQGPFGHTWSECFSDWNVQIVPTSVGDFQIEQQWLTYGASCTCLTPNHSLVATSLQTTSWKWVHVKHTSVTLRSISIFGDICVAKNGHDVCQYLAGAVGISDAMGEY